MVTELRQCVAGGLRTSGDADQPRIIAEATENSSGGWFFPRLKLENEGNFLHSDFAPGAWKFVNEHPGMTFNNFQDFLVWLLDVIVFCQKPGHPLLTLSLTSSNFSSERALTSLIIAMPQA